MDTCDIFLQRPSLGFGSGAHCARAAWLGACRRRGTGRSPGKGQEHAAGTACQGIWSPQLVGSPASMFCHDVLSCLKLGEIWNFAQKKKGTELNNKQHHRNILCTVGLKQHIEKHTTVLWGLVALVENSWPVTFSGQSLCSLKL